MESLRQKLFGGAKSLRDKLAESITGSYEVKKLNEDTNYVTDTPNILERIGGQRTESYPVKKQEPRPLDTSMPIMSYDTERASEVEKPMKPRKENLLNKLRDKVEDVFDGDGQQAAVIEALPPGAQKIDAEDSAPEGSNVERINGELITSPKEARIYDAEKFRKGIVYNENRGAIAAGKNPYESVGPTGDVGKYQASPATIAAWSKPWLGKKMTTEEFKKDPDAQERFFNEFINVKNKYDVSDEDAAIMWHRGWGVLGFNESFEQKKKRLEEYLNDIREEDISQNYLRSFKEGTSTEE